MDYLVTILSCVILHNYKTPLFPFHMSRVAIRVVVIKRPLVSRPAIVGLPGRVAALEE